MTTENQVIETMSDEIYGEVLLQIGDYKSAVEHYKNKGLTIPFPPILQKIYELLDQEDVKQATEIRQLTQIPVPAGKFWSSGVKAVKAKNWQSAYLAFLEAGSQASFLMIAENMKWKKNPDLFFDCFAAAKVPIPEKIKRRVILYSLYNNPISSTLFLLKKIENQVDFKEIFLKYAKKELKKGFPDTGLPIYEFFSEEPDLKLVEASGDKARKKRRWKDAYIAYVFLKDEKKLKLLGDECYEAGAYYLGTQAYEQAGVKEIDENLLLICAEKCMKTGNYHYAAACLKQAKNGPGQKKLGKLYAKEGNYDEAIELLVLSQEKFTPEELMEIKGYAAEAKKMKDTDTAKKICAGLAQIINNQKKN